MKWALLCLLLAVPAAAKPKHPYDVSFPGWYAVDGTRPGRVYLRNRFGAIDTISVPLIDDRYIVVLFMAPKADSLVRSHAHSKKRPPRRR